MKQLILILFGAGIFFLLGGMAGKVLAWSYNGGDYTNLCGSGTNANAYTCDPGCDPNNGSCVGDPGEVVKWTCDGRWYQCLERESTWSSSQSVGNPGCGKTVQISLFDRKCRREDGTWDNNCVMKGYLVWYSGDCFDSMVTPAPTIKLAANPTPTPTVFPTITPRPTVSIRPTPTAPIALPTVIGGNNQQNTPTPTLGGVNDNKGGAEIACNSQCSSGVDCTQGFACVAGSCRNPACTGSTDCSCNVTGTTPTTTPKTGSPLWLEAAGLFLVGMTGWKMRRYAKELWV